MGIRRIAIGAFLAAFLGSALPAVQTGGSIRYAPARSAPHNPQA